LINVSRALSLSRDHVPRLGRHYLKHRDTSVLKVVKVVVCVNPLSTIVLAVPHCLYRGLQVFGDVIHVTTIKLALEHVDAQNS